MFYHGPTQTDYVNIRALNREFVRILRFCPDQFGLDALQSNRLAALGRQQLERLASTPFLLFTIGENDIAAWRSICRADPNIDLFEASGETDAGISNLIATTVGFLWQLAQLNPYSVRLICGASAPWCEMIAEMTYFRLVVLTRARGDLLAIRQARNADIWSKLLADGVNAERRVRTAAHIAALQTLLTQDPAAGATAWPVAACKTAPAYLQVAEEMGKV